MAKTRKEVKQDSPPKDDFGALFQHYLLRRTERLLDQVAADDQLLDEEVRSKALAALEFALESQDAHALAGKLLLAMAPKMERAGFRDEWMVYLKHWLTSETAQHNSKYKGEIEYQLGFLSQLCADFETAKEYLQKSRDTFTALNDTGGQAKALNRLAFVARLQNQSQEARTFVKQAMELSGEGKSESEYSHFTFAILEEDAGNYSNAIHHYRISVNLCQQLRDNHKIALRLGSLGLGLYLNKEFEEAIQCFHKSIAMFTELKDEFRVAAMKMNLGIVYLVNTAPSQAMELFIDAEKVYRSLQDFQHLALIYLNMGIAKRDLGEIEKSIELLSVSLDYCKQVGSIAPLINTMDELGLTYITARSYQKAIDTFKDAIKKIYMQPNPSEYSKLEQRLLIHNNQASQLLSNSNDGQQ